MRSRLLETPSTSFFLFGPRGTGKSTWLRMTYPDAHVIDLLDETSFQEYLADPGLLAAELRGLADERWVVIDEVQRLPSMLNEVHRAIEERRQRFVLCGSSARKLRRGGVNLLGGRAGWKAMHPFLPAELGDDFALDSSLQTGLLPIVVSSVDPNETRDAYVRMYLKEEIKAEALVRNLPSFARFLPVAALYHAQVLNLSGLARDVGVARSTVVGFLSILEDTLIAFRLPAFEAKARARERRHPKLYFVDAGIVRALGRRRQDPSPDEYGHLFEGFIAGVLRAYRDYRMLFDDWWYWASGSSMRVEVDFVLRRGDDFVAIEVKSNPRRPGAGDLRGLRALAELPGLCRRLVVTTGRRRLVTEDGIEVLPLASFLTEVHTGSLFPERS